jgi:hypothetical protein
MRKKGPAKIKKRKKAPQKLNMKGFTKHDFKGISKSLTFCR